MLIIGSRALALVAPYLLKRKPRDFDFICSPDEYSKLMKSGIYTEVKGTTEQKKIATDGNNFFEFELALPGTSAKLADELVQRKNIGMDKIAPLDLLFTIKTSHRYLKNSKFFYKTLGDYHLMKLHGAKVRPEYKEFLALREKETYIYAHPSLLKDKKMFFADDQIKYIYDHDSIHEAVKTLDKPAYLYFKKDDYEVNCDRNKFEALDISIKIAAVHEEASVLALERSLIPLPGVLSPEQAWRLAYSKVASSITSGWFREFAYENALQILKTYPRDFFLKFEEGVKKGLVKKLAKAQEED